MYKIEKKKIMISASVSCMDLMNLREYMEITEQAGVDFYHFDVVDGQFNNCFILGQTLLEAMRGYTKLPIEVHLAVYNPEKYIEQFIKSGADYVGVHYEAIEKPLEIFEKIIDYGAEPVLTYRAETEFKSKDVELFRNIAWINKLTVNPGYSGQTIQLPALDHISKIYKAIKKSGSDIMIQADGNVNVETIPMIVNAGATILTGGTSGLFNKENTVAQNYRRMFDAAKANIKLD